MTIRNRIEWISIPLLLLVLETGSALADPPRTVASLDLDRYMGRWYEIAAVPNYFQRHCVGDTTADYRLREDAMVAVTNRCRKDDDTFEEARGVARAIDPDNDAKLEVSFVRLFGRQLFWGDYWIIGLGTDYEYALVGTPSRRWGWILARDPGPSKRRIATWLEHVREQGYDPTDFVLTNHSARDADVRPLPR